MSNIVTIAFSTEGTTDKRFLASIIRKTFEKVAFECESTIEVYEPVYIQPVTSQNKLSFVQSVESISKLAFDRGINILCIHVDADHSSDNEVFNNKINPAFSAVQQLPIETCKNLVSIVPIRMSEAWMLADNELLKTEIGTTKTDQDLILTRDPESVANPKHCIEEALRIAQDHLPKRRGRVTISELYQPIGQQISLEKLEALSSYRKFKDSVEDAFRKLNYLH